MELIRLISVYATLDIHDMLMQRKSAVESNAQVHNWRAELNTSAINIDEFSNMLQVNNLLSNNK